MAISRKLYQLKITLRNTRPTIWRRIQIWEDISLAELHTTLQIVMDWEDCHVHQFTIGRRRYGVADPEDDEGVIDECFAILCDVVPRAGTEFKYLYDFGDFWQHTLLLEAVLTPEVAGHYPSCIAGARCSPPEDMGGPSGYEEYLYALADPTYENHEAMARWRGAFDPEVFSTTQVNERLKRKFCSKG